MPRTTATRTIRGSSASTTREALFVSGLRRFAADGWRTARVRDIVTDAGQANDSAVNYHFGSRTGLLEEILTRGVARMEEERRADLDRWRTGSPDLGEVVRAVVAPLADLLADEVGRCTLRVIAQVGALTEVGRTVTAGPVAGTALQDQIELLVTEAARRSGDALARHRVRQLVVMVTAELAGRAADAGLEAGRDVYDDDADARPGLDARPDDDARPGVDADVDDDDDDVAAAAETGAVAAGTGYGARFPAHSEYVADLVDWLAAGLARE